MEKTEVLKPCPFDGCPAQISWDENYRRITAQCGVVVEIYNLKNVETVEDLIAFWNTRAGE